MSKFENLFKQKADELESKRLPNIMNKGRLALENYINNTQLKIIEKESVLETLDLRFVRGETDAIGSILTNKADLKLLKAEEKEAQAYLDEMFKD
jgi:hypothetical protein